MSSFKTQGIIIKTKKIADKNILYSIFTLDYGKILCNKKIGHKEKPLDLGYITQFEIHVKEGINIHKIHNIKISHEFNHFGNTFSLIHNFLHLLNIIDKKLPEKLQHSEIYHIIEFVITYQSLTSTKIILAQIKISSLLGILNIQHKNSTIQKILHFIHKNTISQIFKLTGITPQLEKELSHFIQEHQ